MGRGGHEVCIPAGETRKINTSSRLSASGAAGLPASLGYYTCAGVPSSAPSLSCLLIGELDSHMATHFYHYSPLCPPFYTVRPWDTIYSSPAPKPMLRPSPNMTISYSHAPTQPDQSLRPMPRSSLILYSLPIVVLLLHTGNSQTVQVEAQISHLKKQKFT